MSPQQLWKEIRGLFEQGWTLDKAIHKAVNTKKRYGFDHGFNLVQESVHPQYCPSTGAMASKVGRMVSQPGSRRQVRFAMVKFVCVCVFVLLSAWTLNTFWVRPVESYSKRLDFVFGPSTQEVSCLVLFSCAPFFYGWFKAKPPRMGLPILTPFPFRNRPNPLWLAIKTMRHVPLLLVDRRTCAISSQCHRLIPQIAVGQE